MRRYKMTIRNDFNGRPCFVKICGKQFFRVHPYYWDDSVHYGRMYRYIPLEESPVQEIWMNDKITNTATQKTEKEEEKEVLELDDVVNCILRGDDRTQSACWFNNNPTYVTCIPLTDNIDINQFNSYIRNGPTHEDFCGYVVTNSKIYLVYASVEGYGTYPPFQMDSSNTKEFPLLFNPSELDDLSYLKEGKTLAYTECQGEVCAAFTVVTDGVVIKYDSEPLDEGTVMFRYSAWVEGGYNGETVDSSKSDSETKTKTETETISTPTLTTITKTLISASGVKTNTKTIASTSTDSDTDSTDES